MPRRRRARLFRVVALTLAFGILELLSAAVAAVISYPRIRRASVLYAEQAAEKSGRYSTAVCRGTSRFTRCSVGVTHRVFRAR